jgi:anti-sigma B factor antagonist
MLRRDIAHAGFCYPVGIGGREVRIQSKELDGIVALHLQGKLMGGPDADTFRKTIYELLERGKKKVIVDLKSVNWVNSTGVGILISGYTTLRKSGGDLKLVHVSEKIRSILYVTKLNLIFECFDSEDEAIASFDE